MNHELIAFKNEILKACENIKQFIGNMNLEQYSNNALVKAGVERQFEIIGEVVTRLSKEFPLAYSKISNGRKIIDFRNLIFHGYDVISDDRVYEVVKVFVPQLEKDIQNF